MAHGFLFTDAPGGARPGAGATNLRDPVQFAAHMNAVVAGTRKEQG